MSIFGARLRHLRAEKKLTMDKLSELSGVSTTHICRLENGSRFPSQKALVKLSAGLQVSAEELKWGTK